MSVVTQRNAPLARAQRYLIAAMCVLVITLMLGPIALSFFASIKPPAEASASPPNYLPHSVSAENYQKVFDYQAGLFTYAGNSFLVAAIAIVLCLALAVPAGYGLARFRLPAKELIFVLLLAPLMIPYQAILTPIYLNFSKIGLANSHLGLAIVHAVLQLPFSIYLMRNSFEAIPREIEEAALIDGASSFQVLRRIFLPLVVPGMVTVTLFTFINSWNEFLADLHEQGDGLHHAYPAGISAHRAAGRGGLGGAAGRGHRLRSPLHPDLCALAEILRVRLPQRCGQIGSDEDRHGQQGRRADPLPGTRHHSRCGGTRRSLDRHCLQGAQRQWATQAGNAG
jgi:multiple sugar transport system permease protein